MSEFKQPWRPIKVDGRRARLQILDPATAFAWEPTLVGLLGDTLSFAVSAPDQIFGAVLARAAGPGIGAGLDIRHVLSDPVHGPEMAASTIRLVGSIVANAIERLQIEPQIARKALRDFAYGRLKVGDALIEDAEAWSVAGLRPMAKWVVIAAQIRQTFGPLWTRAPYQLRSESKTYGVPEPSSVPLAVRWADNLAKNKSASSSHEILTTWTPVRMIEVVENNAYQNEIDRRAHEAAKR